MEALNLKKLRSRLALAYFVVVLLFLIGCSTPTYIYREVPYYVPAIHDTITLLPDTVYAPTDSNAYWEGNVEDSLKNVIGWLKVYYNRQIAELKLNPHTDTLIITDTAYVDKDRPVQVLVGLLPWWGETLVILFIAGLLALTSKKTNIWNLIKGIFK